MSANNGGPAFPGYGMTGRGMTLRERRHAAAAHHYGAMAAEADKGREYTYTIFRIVAGRYVECQHVGTLASIPDGWSWMKREREA